MTKTSNPRPTRRVAKIGALALTGAAVIAFSPATATVANAQTPYWSPVESTCGSLYVELTFHVTGTSGIVHVGYSDRDAGYGNGPYWALHHGTNTIETGLKTVFWQKWSNTGNADISSWSKACRNFT